MKKLNDFTDEICDIRKEQVLLYYKLTLVILMNETSTSALSLQKTLKVSLSTAEDILDELEIHGVVGPSISGKRAVYVKNNRKAS